MTYARFRLFFNTEDVFTCLAIHLGNAIEQLSEFVGESFSARCIREVRQETKDGWVVIKHDYKTAV